ncbi:hypothetical protein L249_5284 [Ophiocordyceps polyrhachis-furcata BCC 54312]|uniref:Uncharacterized protein n=1 Tax=Ophiocordyceps polyrhachis-furcata BCC 54312 TaxID=1330021 RepID=A0A367L8M2_9HYPO|nr:hypothetical protein L249_5284 [Ophiocordyceps polyrhachis-furcata BCC 54312]
MTVFAGFVGPVVIMGSWPEGAASRFPSFLSLAVDAIEFLQSNASLPAAYRLGFNRRQIRLVPSPWFPSVEKNKASHGVVRKKSYADSDREQLSKGGRRRTKVKFMRRDEEVEKASRLH